MDAPQNPPEEMDSPQNSPERDCRKFIGLDGCFLKGVCKGQLLSAVARNGNHQIYPLAWAVVHTETTESWTWFIELLRKDLDLGRGDGLAVVTDMQKGLEVAISNVLPAAEHRECARHVIANWAKNYRGTERRQCFWKIAKSTFEGEVKVHLRAIRELGDENIVPDLLRYNIERWCRVYVKEGTCCDSMDNSVAESFNSWVLAARYKSIISMLQEIRQKVMSRHGDMIKGMDKWAINISPVSYKIIDKNAVKARKCTIIWNGDVGYEVSDGNFRHTVNIANKTCSCRAWALKGIPCAHAIVALQDKGLDPIDYVAHWYQKETYIKAYSDFIQPVPDLKLMPELGLEPVMPPPMKPMPGRPKRNRRKSVDELNKFGKESRKGNHVRCSYCRQWDHNKKTCDVRLSGAPPVEKMKSTSTSKTKRGTASNQPNVNQNPSSSKQTMDKRTSQVPCSSNSQLGATTAVPTRNLSSSSQPVPTNVVPTRDLISSALVTGDLGFNPRKRK